MWLCRNRDPAKKSGELETGTASPLVTKGVLNTNTPRQIQRITVVIVIVGLLDVFFPIHETWDWELYSIQSTRPVLNTY